MLLVFCFILFYVSRVLRRFRSISAASAVRSGADPEEAGNTGKLRLSGNRFLPVNLFLGLRDVLKRKRLYATMLAVTVLACFIMVVPQNLYHTISDDRFVTYMGVGLSDIRLDIQQTGNFYTDQRAGYGCAAGNPRCGGGGQDRTGAFHAGRKNRQRAEAAAL